MWQYSRTMSCNANIRPLRWLLSHSFIQSSHSLTYSLINHKYQMQRPLILSPRKVKFNTLGFFRLLSPKGTCTISLQRKTPPCQEMGRAWSECSHGVGMSILDPSNHVFWSLVTVFCFGETNWIHAACTKKIVPNCSNTGTIHAWKTIL